MPTTAEYAALAGIGVVAFGAAAYLAFNRTPLTIQANGTITSTSQPLIVKNNTNQDQTYIVYDQTSQTAGTLIFTVVAGSQQSIDGSLVLPSPELAKIACYYAGKAISNVLTAQV